MNTSTLPQVSAIPERIKVGGTRAVWTIAERELSTRLKQRSFQIMTAVMVAAIVVGMALVHLLGGGGNGKHIGTTDDTLNAVVNATQAAGITADVSVVDPANASALVTDGGFAAVVTAGEHGQWTVYVDRTLDPQLAAVLNAVAQQQALADQITALGGNPADVATALGGAGVSVVAVNPPADLNVPALLAGMAVGIMIYMGLMIGAQFVAQGVVEEKTSRVVELLLSTVKPSQLMAGKVLGIGLLGLIQIGLVVAATVITASILGMLDGIDLNLGTFLIWAIVWFVIGFATYAILIAGLAALVSRQEEVGSVITPALMLTIIPYMVGIAVLPNDPTSELARIMSLIPGFSPILMPMRDGFGVVAAWEPWAALALSLAVIPLLIWFAGKIYSNAVLRTGARIKLGDALKGA